MKTYLNILDLVEIMGFTTGLDFDDTLTLTPPAAIDVAAVTQYLLTHERKLTEEVRFRGQAARACFIGGPLNGQANRYLGLMLCVDETHRVLNYGQIVHRVGRARWAAYACASDRRAFFVGWATSEKKAKCLAARFCVVTERSEA